MLMAITAVASPFLDNVTTIMLVAPVTVVVCDRLRIPAAPYLIAEVLASNIGGASTLIGDPPNIIIASRAGLTFNDFLVHMAPIVVLVFVAFVLLSWVLFRKSFTYDERYVAEVMSLDERKAITDPALLVRCLVVLGLVIVAFMLHSVLHLEPSIVALVGAGVMLLVSRVEVADVLREVEWPVLVFFMGLFVMVAGLGHTGVIEAIGTWAAETIGDNHFVAATSLLFGSAVLGAFFDNIPYAATMAPIVEGWPRVRRTRAPPGAVVVVRAGRRLRRQRDGRRRERQRRRDRHRRQDRPPDQLLAVHPLRHHRHGTEHADGVGVRGPALLLARRHVRRGRARL